VTRNINGSIRMRNGSTSKFIINCDFPMSKALKILSFLVNLFRNFPRQVLRRDIKLIRLANSKFVAEKILTTFDRTQSPSRNLSNLFWETLNLKQVSIELNNQIRALEIGCGSARYSRYFSRTNLDFEYTGIDVVKHAKWDELTNPRIITRINTYLDFNKFVSESNFIFTQSAAEHFEDDALFFKSVDEYCLNSSNPTISVHLVPPAAALFNYLWHGIRQYPISSINVIAGRKSNNKQTFLMTLGGPKSNRIHRNFITIPTLLRNKDFRALHPEKYFYEMSRSATADLSYTGYHQAAFYVLINCYNFNSKDISKLFKERCVA